MNLSWEIAENCTTPREKGPHSATLIMMGGSGKDALHPQEIVGLQKHPETAMEADSH